jgi:putative aldouronate transport system permease protein
MEAISQATHSKKKKSNLKRRLIRYYPAYIMFLPAAIILFLFSYLPMRNIDIAFYDYNTTRGKIEFLGWENFERLFTTPRFMNIFTNTLVISLTRLFIGMVFAVLLALLLNEIGVKWFKKGIQTAVYLPHFLSWTIVASAFNMILSPTSGLTGPIFDLFGIAPEHPLMNQTMWRPLFYMISLWRETGYATIVYLAAITGIDPSLYEAAAIDGAGKLKQTRFITIPSLYNTMLVVLIMNLATVLNVMEPIFVLQNPLVYEISDVIGTYAYRTGLLNRDYAYATAIGLFRGVIASILMLIANTASKRVRGRGLL